MSEEKEKKKFHRAGKTVQKVFEISVLEIDQEAKRTRRETPGVAYHRKTMERYGKQINGDPLQNE